MVQCGQRIEQLEHDIAATHAQTEAREAQLAHELKIRSPICLYLLFCAHARDWDGLQKHKVVQMVTHILFATLTEQRASLPWNAEPSPHMTWHMTSGIANSTHRPIQTRSQNEWGRDIAYCICSIHKTPDRQTKYTTRTHIHTEMSQSSPCEAPYTQNTHM